MNEVKKLKHIAFIMDGNGRWAKERNLKRTDGHKVGVKNIITILNECLRLGILCVSFYCFSTENWKRPKKEIDYLFKYLEIFFKDNIDQLVKDGVKINVSGDVSKLKKSTQEIIEKSIYRTKNLNNMVFNICLNYGGRDDIVNASKKIAKDVLENRITIDEIDETLFSKYLYTNSLPEVDLLIRTSGELRISNFLIYQLAYAEFIFNKVKWPDYTIDDLHGDIEIYKTRNRRFGDIINGNKE